MSPGGVCACPPTPPAELHAGEGCHGSTRPAMRGAHWGPLRREWAKLLFTWRTYVIWGGLTAIPFLIALAMYFSDQGPGPGEGPHFLDRVLENGLYVPVSALAAVLLVLLPLAAAVIGSFMIAGEAEIGTLRAILLRPQRRGSLIVSKWIVAVLSLLVGLVLVVAAGILFGALFFGLEPLVTLSGTTVSIPEGIGLIVLTALFALAAMACMVSLALLFSTLTNSSLTALIATFVVFIVVQVLVTFSYFDWLRPYVFTSYFDEYVNFFRDPIAWRPIGEALLVFGLWSAGLTAAAWLVFRRKDILS
jgi:ABC-2 type transport system permease protein